MRDADRRSKLLVLAASERDLGHEAAAANIEAIASSLVPDTAGETPRVFFFGCQHSGHHLYGPRVAGDNAVVDIAPESSTPWKLTEIDGHAQPNCAMYSRAWQVPADAQVLGGGLLHHRAGWTMLSFWDRSKDLRHGSNGNFIIEGTHAFAAACAHTKAAWPRTWLRITTQPGWPAHGEIEEIRGGSDPKGGDVG